ncbi:MAG: hypothetical protein KFH87_04570 [Bacteroidetes bacterium]|nr:hypothetical protein [Bacteroidota bacterium]
MTQEDLSRQGTANRQTIQTLLQGLWERTQKAVEIIRHLRKENRGLLQRIEELEAARQSLQAQLADKDEQITKLQEKTETLSSLDVGNELLYLSPDEREALERQVDDLLRRINSHLGSSR